MEVLAQQQLLEHLHLPLAVDMVVVFLMLVFQGELAVVAAVLVAAAAAAAAAEWEVLFFQT
jgi:hypothetical protein